MRLIEKTNFIAFMLLVISSIGACAPNDEISTRSNVPQPAYTYPIDNGYAATIIGTPAEIKMRYPRAITPDEKKLIVFPERKIPEGYWYYDGLLYGQMLQNTSAPLVYIIGGTGSGYKSRFTISLANTLYQAGYHVIMLPSPTHANFIVTASNNFFPGYAQSDAEDLYRVIAMIQERIKEKHKITSTHITGYSLGGWHAAFVSHLDSQRHKIGFDKTLLINPPLNLYNSVSRLDNMLLRDLAGGIDDLDAFLDNAITRMSQLKNSSDAFDFSNEDLLWDTYRQLKPTEDKMATTIGLAFRFSAANMVFTADVMSHANYIFPADRPFLSTTPLNNYMPVALRTGFGDYYNDIYTIHYLHQNPGFTQNDLIRKSSLEDLRGWILENPRIGLITNRDDIILSPGEITTLETLFTGKSWVFPSGGHLGNIEHPSFCWRITQFLAEAQE